MPVETNKRRRRSGLPQERGVKRRKMLKATALDLLSRSSFQDITYQSIADEAGVPLASCYNFYKSKLDLVRVLADELTDNFLDAVFDRTKYADTDSWMDCIDRNIKLAVAHHNRSQAELQIFFSGDVPRAMRQDALEREKIIGRRLRELLEGRFELPDIPDADNVFFRAIEIARTVLALDYQERGDLTEASASEAVRAVTGYLGNYLPPMLAPLTRQTS